jgi:ABC-2 type transport system ATP-binding protein
LTLGESSYSICISNSPPDNDFPFSGRDPAGRPGKDQTPERAPLVEVKNLTRMYGPHAAVDAISFRAEKGEILGFLGPNGAGKTTTMRMLTCFLPPTSGTARVAGYDILEHPAAVRNRVGYLPENVPLYGDLTVSSYLDYVGKLKGLDRSTLARRTGEVMEECGTTEVRHQLIGTLSRGYRQRVGLAQALLGDPEVLILDEPTVGLDPRQIIEIRQLIRGLAGRRTVILSTHILPEVSLVCQRVIIINNGVLVTDDSPENLGRTLRRSMQLEVTARGDFESIQKVLLGIDDVDGVRKLEPEDGETVRLAVVTRGDADVREAVAHRLVSGGFGLIDLRAHKMSLEDIFVRLVTEEGGAAPDDPGGENGA